MDEMSADGLFNLGFVLGMAAMWLMVRGVRFWRERLEKRAAARAAIPAPAEADTRAEEIRALHERLAVLERIATDPAERTAREIEALRS